MKNRPVALVGNRYIATKNIANVIISNSARYVRWPFLNYSLSSTPKENAACLPHHLAQQDEAITVIGIELRTTNLDAMQTIPPLWQRFGQDGVQASIPGKLDGDVLAVYTRFDLVGAAWHAVWANTALRKTFVAEYERYHANSDISISIGLA